MTVVDEPRSFRDYVAFMECRSAEPWMDSFTSELQTWLHSKGLPVDAADSHDHVAGSTRLSVRRLASPGAESLRMTLLEDSPKQGRFTTELLAHRDPVGDWISVTVRNSQGTFVNVPRLVRRLATTLQLHDGALDFSEVPRLFTSDDLDQLLAMLRDGRRHGLVFVVGTPPGYAEDMSPLVTQMTNWARETAGLARIVVLDPAATSAFARRVGEDFEVPHWAVRGFRPSVRFDVPADSRRHRYVTLSRLARLGDHGITMLLGDIARQETIDRPAEPVEQEVRRLFARAENRRLVDRVREPEVPTESDPVVPDKAEGVTTSTDVATEPPTPEPVGPTTPPETEPDSGTEPTGEAGVREQLTLVQRLLGIPRITENALKDFLARVRRSVRTDAVTALEERIDQLQAQLEKAEDENRELDAALTEADYELDFARLTEEETAARMKWLEARLKDHNDFEHTYAAVPEEYLVASPNNFDDLLERIEQFPTVEFTGDRSECIKLDMQSNADTALGWAWDAVLVLADYARARQEGACEHGLDHYINHTPPGFRTMSAGRFAETETSTTMQQHGASRMFRVPTSVDSTGSVPMKAHFKLDRRGLYPRMHIYDGHPTSPRIFIGYIGPHLPIASH